VTFFLVLRAGYKVGPPSNKFLCETSIICEQGTKLVKLLLKQRNKAPYYNQRRCPKLCPLDFSQPITWHSLLARLQYQLHRSHQASICASRLRPLASTHTSPSKRHTGNHSQNFNTQNGRKYIKMSGGWNNETLITWIQLIKWKKGWQQYQLLLAFYFHSTLVTTNGDKWKGTEPYVIDMTYKLSLQASPGDKDSTPILWKP
jgi:hypothetical protein